MTQTIKLSDTGGITFTDGKLDLVGEPNKISFPEVKQRTRIRFQTQRMTNTLHPYDGFDLYAVRKGSSDAKNMSLPLTPEMLVDQEIRACIYQDPAIDSQNITVTVEQSTSRHYIAHVKYQIKGSMNKTFEYTGDMMIS